MSEINDGGTAFPHATTSMTIAGTTYVTGAENHPGMSLRDYFAAAAMQSLIMITSDALRVTYADLCKEAYEYADVMIAECDKEAV